MVESHPLGNRPICSIERNNQIIYLSETNKRYLVTTDSLDDTSQLETDKDGFIMPSGKNLTQLKLFFTEDLQLNAYMSKRA